MDTDAVTGTVKAAVIGVGHLGRHHARLMAGLDGVELVGVVDADAARAAEIAGPLGAAPFTSLGALPDDLHVASVAVPTSAHLAVAGELLARGVHVLVEKPMAATLDEARELERLAERHRRVLHVGHVERFNPALRAFAEVGGAPRFIQAQRLAPFNYRTLDVSVVMDLMIHDLDIVLSLVRAPLAGVEAVGSRVLSGNVDLADARLTFEDGCVAQVTASRVSFEAVRSVRVFTDEAFVSMDLGARKAFVARRAEGFEAGSLEAGSVERFPPRDSFAEFVSQGMLDIQEHDLDGPDVNPLRDELAAFVGAVRGEQGPGVTAAEGLAAMELADAVTDAIAAHRFT